MSESTHVPRRAHALRAVLLACLALALAAPGAASAATVGKDGGDSRASTALEGTDLVGAEGESRADLAAESAGRSERDQEPGEEPSGELEAEDPDEEPSAPDDRGSRNPRDSIGREVRQRTKDIGDSVRRDVESRTRDLERPAPDGGGEPDQTLPGGPPDEAPRDVADDPGAEDTVRISVSAAEDERINLDGRDNRQIYLGRTATVRGLVPSKRPGREVALEVYSKGRWVEVDRDVTDENGRFSMTWKPGYAGRRFVRVRRTNPTSTEPPSGIRTLYVYRRRVASWYGPGFYGNRTACGQTFTSRLLGVAHRSLPCGYLVTIRYNGRYKTVPVVDRGPYISGRHFDLTEALRNYLGFDGVDTIRATA